MDFSVVGQFELNCDRGVHKHEVTEQDPFLSGQFPVYNGGSFPTRRVTAK
jgi:hypothetical protein